MTGPLSVAVVAKRDGRHCLDCGATEALSIQHRANKGMGGSKRAERRSNGVILCAVLNARLEQEAHLAAMARRYGWKLWSWQDPERVPFYDVSTGLWWVASDDGTRRPATPAEVAEHLAEQSGG